MTEEQRVKGIYRTTIVGSVVNLLLVVCKFVAGILGRSTAVVADAGHSLSDLLTDIVGIAFQVSLPMRIMATDMVNMRPWQQQLSV